MIVYPDISQWQGSIDLTGAPLVCARSSIGTRRDEMYPQYRIQCQAKRIPFAGYHFLYSSNVGAQAELAYKVNGPNTPLMLDIEKDGSSVATISDGARFIDVYRDLGGICQTVYLPKWYWQQYLGSESLQPLIKRGMYLVSSNYTESTTAGWQPYGGMTPSIWQYTDGSIPRAHYFNGRQIDLNRFDGTLEQLLDVFGFAKEGVSTPMKTILVAARGSNKVFLSNGLFRVHVGDHEPADNTTDAMQILKDVRWVGTTQLGSLISTNVHYVDDLDAYGKEFPPDLVKRLEKIEKALDEILAKVSE